MNRRLASHLVALVVAVAAGTPLAGTAWAKAAPTAAPAKGATHAYVVKNGDGWSQVARAHGTSMQHLLAANHATAGTPLKSGQRIHLPADAHDPPATRHAAQSAPAGQGAQAKQAAKR